MNEPTLEERLESLSCASGMGLTTYTAARILKGQLQNQTGEETVMTMDTFPSVGLAKVLAHTHTHTLTNTHAHAHKRILTLFLYWGRKVEIMSHPSLLVSLI